MNPILQRLGISQEVQAFFHADKLHFDYGGISEMYDDGFHYVPTTTGLWVAGSQYAREVMITNAAMEAIAWYMIHRHRYTDPAALALISLGNLPSAEQVIWLRTSFSRRKFILVFGDGLLGNLTDIKVACLLSGKAVSLCWQNRKAVISIQHRTAYFNEIDCSLHHFEKVFGLRLGIRTSKPAQHATYLTQLQYDSRTDHPSPRA